jgi:antitoxin component HigA of HigAB toxin-antitoxin module
MRRGTRALKTRADHRAALKEIERLMDATPNTAAGRRLDVLVRLVDAYESRHDPIEPPSRAEALRYTSESRRVRRTKPKNAAISDSDAKAELHGQALAHP